MNFVTAVTKLTINPSICTFIVKMATFKFMETSYRDYKGKINIVTAINSRKLYIL